MSVKWYDIYIGLNGRRGCAAETACLSAILPELPTFP